MTPPQLFSLLVLDGIPPTLWNESPVVPPLAAYSCLSALRQLFSAWKPPAPPTPAWETPTQLSQPCGHHFLQDSLLIPLLDHLLPL